MVALATLGACFGVLAIVVLVLFFPMFMKQRDDLRELRYDLTKLREDFADGLRELQENVAAPDETGIWLPRPDPVTQGTAYVKQKERSAQVPAGVSPLSEIDELEALLNGKQGRN